MVNDIWPERHNQGNMPKHIRSKEQYNRDLEALQRIESMPESVKSEEQYTQEIPPRSKEPYSSEKTDLIYPSLLDVLRVSLALKRYELKKHVKDFKAKYKQRKADSRED